MPDASSLRIAVGGDHAGFDLKSAVNQRFREHVAHWIDCGTHDTASSDYPDVAVSVTDRLTAGQVDRGILICGSGVGRIGCRQQGARHPRGDLPRHLFRRPGRGARRHERAVHRRPDHRQRIGVRDHRGVPGGAVHARRPARPAAGESRPDRAAVRFVGPGTRWPIAESTDEK